ncbi:hypothetical protein AC1031_019741 [Aphanomyces cochlioides]|nr:hypothetical protein AC1031_019741 [Aphanomyces cochlioides]
MTLAATALQDKLESYGSIQTTMAPTSSPILPPLSRSSVSSASSSSPFTRSPYNTTPKRKMSRKGSSVEFAPNHLDNDANADDRPRECRRLSLREKQELYKVRPDLEIGTPHAMQSMIDEQNHQRRQVACSLFFGITCVIMLVLFYYFIAWNMSEDRDYV